MNQNSKHCQIEKKEEDLSKLQAMSFRQQTLYIMAITREDQPAKSYPSFEEDIEELKEYLEQERIRHTQPDPRTLFHRNRLTEEACKSFKFVRRSIYLERKPQKLTGDEIMTCNCRHPTKVSEGPFSGKWTVSCGRKCLNRVISIECSAETCPSGEHCTNRRFQLQQHVQVYAIKTQNRGWGLAAGQFIKKGSFVIQYLGEIYSVDSPLGMRRLEKYRDHHCTYLMSTSNNEVIDPTKKGNLARFLNHSCDPNCETQKWNVLGEICVGIFAKRDIQQEEELTFDYRFDTHRTALSRCLCGTKKCRQYLGLIPPEHPLTEDWVDKLESLKCFICNKASGEEDEYLILCDYCNRGFHTYCLKPPLEEVPLKDSWLCSDCSKKDQKPKSSPRKKRKVEETQVEQQVEQQEVKMLVSVDVVDKLRSEYLHNIIDQGFKLFWGQVDSEGNRELKIRGENPEIVQNLLKKISLEVKPQPDIQEEISQLEVKVEAILLKYFIGPNEETVNKYQSLYNIQITYDKDYISDKIYGTQDFTAVILTGHRSNVSKAAQVILEYLDSIVISKIYLTLRESSFLMKELGNFKSLLYPVDIRVSTENVSTSSSHPFYFFSKQEKQTYLIGAKDQINNAKSQLISSLFRNFNWEREFSLSFVLPMKTINHLRRIKLDVVREVSHINSEFSPIIKYYEPLPPRKYLTVFILGNWKQCIECKRKILELCENYLGGDELNKFFWFVKSQICRHMLKNATKFIHSLEKRIGVSENEVTHWKISPQKNYILKSWDLYSAEVLCPIPDHPQIVNSTNNILEHLRDDCDSFINLVRLCSSPEQLRFLVEDKWKISMEDALKLCNKYFHNFQQKYEAIEKVGYLNTDVKELGQVLLDLSDEEDLFEEDGAIITNKILESIRKEKQAQETCLVSKSFGEEYSWELPEETEQKIEDYLENLHKAKVIMGSDVYMPISDEECSVLPVVKQNADLIVGCSKNSKNFLYVVFAEKAKTIEISQSYG